MTKKIFLSDIDEKNFWYVSDDLKKKMFLVLRKKSSLTGSRSTTFQNCLLHCFTMSQVEPTTRTMCLLHIIRVLHTKIVNKTGWRSPTFVY